MPYRNAPIVEAILQYQFSEPLPDSDMIRVARKLAPAYAQKEDLHDFNVQVRVTGQSPVSEINTSKPWYRLISKDGSDIAVVNRAHIAVSKKAPYTKWEEFKSRFERDHSATMKTVGHRSANRIGLRYINRIDVPDTHPDKMKSAAFLNAFPSVPTGLSDELQSNFLRFEFKEKQMGAVVIVSTGNVEPVLLNHTSYMLDIDVVVQDGIPLRHDELYKKIDEMRLIKNETFESLITDEARKLFDD